MADIRIALFAVVLICIVGVVFARLWAPLLIDSWRYLRQRKRLPDVGTADAVAGDGPFATKPSPEALGFIDHADIPVDRMRRSIHRSHRGEGKNFVD